MKKIILFLGIVFLASCRKTTYESTLVKNPEQVTNIEMLKSTDTCIVYFSPNVHTCYLLKDGKVRQELQYYNNDETSMVVGSFLLLICLIFVLGVLVALVYFE